MEFHSDLLKSVYNSKSTYFNSHSHIILLIGDLPKSNSNKIVKDSFKSTESNLWTKKINNLKINYNYLVKIPISKNIDYEYFLFSDLNKTKMNIVVIGLEKNINKKNIISLYEIPIDNFIKHSRYYYNQIIENRELQLSNRSLSINIINSNDVERSNEEEVNKDNEGINNENYLEVLRGRRKERNNIITSNANIFEDILENSYFS